MIVITAQSFLVGVLDITFIVLLFALFLVSLRLVRGPSLPDRVVALELISILVVGFIAAFDIATEQHVFLDVAIALALVSFLGSVAFARYIQKGAMR